MHGPCQVSTGAAALVCDAIRTALSRAGAGFAGQFLPFPAWRCRRSRAALSTSF
jgi:hypothetical protein